MSAQPLLIQSRHGPLYAHPDDRYLGEAVCKYGEYSELEYRFLADVLGPDDGRNIIEVGANAGFLSVPLSWHGNLFAFEPQTSVFNLLTMNATAGHAWNGKNIFALRSAISDEYRLISVPVHSYATPGNHGGIPLTRDQSHAAMKATVWEDIPCATLDGMDLENPIKLIKADVEGMELNVLRGARQVIARDKPLLYLENDRPAQSAELIRYVWKLGYWCAWHCPPMFNPDNFFKVKQNIYGNKASVNMICVPNGQTLPPGVGRRHELKLVEDVKLHPVTGM